jgi:GTPase Era involved in 16S rRNA processing
MSIATSSTVKIGYNILKFAEQKGYLNKFKDLFRKKHRVLLLGSTGTGKTQFLNSFGNIFADALSHLARTEFSYIKRVDVSGNLFEFIDTPGQELHKSRRMSTIRKAISGRFSGVIDLVSYGYHEYGADIKNVIKGNSVKKKYLDSHLEREINQINEWAPLLNDEWIITVITKADIWWDNKQNVLDYYKNGLYSKALQAAYNPKAYTVVPYSSLTYKFYNVVPCSGNFSDAERKLLRNSLFQKLTEAIIKM